MYFTCRLFPSPSIPSQPTRPPPTLLPQFYACIAFHCCQSKNPFLVFKGKNGYLHKTINIIDRTCFVSLKKGLCQCIFFLLRTLITLFWHVSCCMLEHFHIMTEHGWISGWWWLLQVYLLWIQKITSKIGGSRKNEHGAIEGDIKYKAP